MCTLFRLNGQADAGDNEAKLITKLAPEWVRASDRSPARYRWTMAPTGISGRYVRYRVDKEWIRLFDVSEISKATILLQDALREVCSKLVDPSKTATLSGDAA